MLAWSTASDTLGALLVELRLLRQALERSATAPRVQLIGTRLTVQNDGGGRGTRSPPAAEEIRAEVFRRSLSDALDALS